MTCRILQCASFLALLAGLGAALPPQPLQWVRQGNAAFARGEFLEAADLYAQAEERIPDPGLAAFNEATAFYQLGRYREAELYYRRCREDAEGPRLARLLFNLANCLVQQGQGSNAARLREAIGLYQQCTANSAAETDLVKDARHNLELARLLWLKARAGKDGHDQDSNADDSEDPRSQSNRNEMEGASPEMANLDPNGRPGAALDDAGAAKAGQARSESPPPPGKGNLPQVPDRDDLVPLSPEDTAAYLSQAATRILRDHQEYRRRAVPALAPSVMDW